MNYRIRATLADGFLVFAGKSRLRVFAFGMLPESGDRSGLPLGSSWRV